MCEYGQETEEQDLFLADSIVMHLDESKCSGSEGFKERL